MNTKGQRFILAVLAFFFLAPGLCAYFIYTHPHWIQLSSTNKGKLEKNPSRFILDKTKKGWHLVLWNPGFCAQDCQKHLDKLARIRLALGRQWYDVGQCLLSADKENASQKWPAMMKKQAIETYVLSKNERKKASFLTNEPQIFLVDPNHYWVLSYTVEAPSADIFSDLKKVLAKNQ